MGPTVKAGHMRASSVAVWSVRWVRVWTMACTSAIWLMAQSPSFRAERRPKLVKPGSSSVLRGSPWRQTNNRSIGCGIGAPQNDVAAKTKTSLSQLGDGPAPVSKCMQATVPKFPSQSSPTSCFSSFDATSRIC